MQNVWQVVVRRASNLYYLCRTDDAFCTSVVQLARTISTLMRNALSLKHVNLLQRPASQQNCLGRSSTLHISHCLKNFENLKKNAPNFGNMAKFLKMPKIFKMPKFLKNTQNF